MKELVRTICTSSTYQLSSLPNDNNLKDRQNFSRYYPKRLSAEVLYDAFHRVTATSQAYSGLPAGTQAMQLPDPSDGTYFLKVFGQPQGDTACECERSQEANLAQSLHLLNSSEVQDKISSQSGRAALLAADKRPAAAKIRELYRWVYSREPNEDELQIALAHLAKHARSAAGLRRHRLGLDQYQRVSVQPLNDRRMVVAEDQASPFGTPQRAVIIRLVGPPIPPSTGRCQLSRLVTPAHCPSLGHVGVMKQSRPSSSYILRLFVAGPRPCLVPQLPRHAQLPQARLYSIFPCGGKAGTTVELTLTSFADLDGVDACLQHPGITAVPKMQKVGGQKKPVPNVFEVTIRPDVPTGVYEVYAGGLLRPVEPADIRRRLAGRNARDRTKQRPENPNELVPGRIVNGTSGRRPMSTSSAFRESAASTSWPRAAPPISTRGMSAVIELLTRWPPARLRARGTATRCHGRCRLARGRHVLHQGARLSLSRRTGIRLSAVGGQLALHRLHHAAGRRRGNDGADSRSLVAICPAASRTDVSVEGRPLEKLDVSISLPSVAPLAPAHTTLGSVSAGRRDRLLDVEDARGRIESRADSIGSFGARSSKKSRTTRRPWRQPVSAPGEFAGRFQAPGDTDYYTFHADAGQVFYIDVFAERIGSMADPYLVVDQVVREPRGSKRTTRITSIDDENSNVAPAVFDTRTDDPNYRFQAPETGTYRILLRDRSFESRGDPRLVYHVSIRPEQPDFRLVVLAAVSEAGFGQGGLDMGPGSAQGGQPRACRSSCCAATGFASRSKSGPKTCPKASLAAGRPLRLQRQDGRVDFHGCREAAAGDAALSACSAKRVVAKKGRAKDAKTETEIVREAIPATIVWSAEADVPAVSRIAQSLALSVMNEAAPFQLSTNVVRLEVNQSRQILLPLTRRPSQRFRRRRAMALVGAKPDTLDMTLKSFPKGKSDELVRCFVPRIERPGTAHPLLEVAGPGRLPSQPRSVRAGQDRTGRAAKEAATKAAR